MAKENKDREKRFEWQEGDISINVSQCATCVFNTGPFKCMVYDKKPPEYGDNREKCPSRKKQK